jgi:SAM-dependent methyltransferase
MDTSRDSTRLQLEKLLASGGGVDRAALRELIETALGLNYISESGRGGIQTGNHYQSVRLGDARTAGFRSDRREFLDRIDFRGRSVLDLGANLGEMSRAACERGAARVVAIEYDDFFVAVARAINLLNGHEPIEVRQGDVGDPAAFDEPFDIVLAFSVYQYIGPVIEAVSSIAAELLVVETHKLEGNLASHYMAPISRHLPSSRFLGLSDWGGEGQEGERAVVAFARSDSALGRVVDAPTGAGPAPPSSDRVVVDVPTTCEHLFGAFRERFPELESGFDALLQRVGELEIVPEREGAGSARAGYRGWLYWAMYLVGYGEYTNTGAVDSTNAFCQFYARHHLPAVAEPGADWESPETIARRRFRDLDRARKANAPTAAEQLGPIRIIVSDPAPPYPLEVAIRSGEVVVASLIDGWHRLFAAQVCGASELLGDRIYERYSPVMGRVEHVATTDTGWTLAGWVLNPDAVWDFAEVRSSGDPLDRVEPMLRTDLAASFPELSHAGSGGFSFDMAPDAGELIDVLPVRDWLPIGRIRLRCPPSVRRDVGLVALATGVGEAVSALGPLANSDGRVIAAGGTVGEIVMELFPAAEVAVLESNDPLSWPVSPACGLVVAGDALASVAESDRAAWLESAARSLAPGGVLLVRDRSVLPPNLPGSLFELARFAPEPVQTSEAAALVRVG